MILYLIYWSLYEFYFPPLLSKLLKNQFTLKKGNKTGLKHPDSHSRTMTGNKVEDANPKVEDTLSVLRISVSAQSKVLDETKRVAHVAEG